MLGQTFSTQDLAVIGLLILLEGVLSIDNALVLGLLAKRLPKSLQNRALTYGLVGAFVFRLIAIGTASYLLRWRIVKLLGGGYLVWIAAKHFLTAKPAEATSVSGEPAPGTGFWSTVLVIELTDIAFAIDSILAAIALVGSPPPGHQGPHPKLWVVIAGGIIGVVLMRFAAVIFIRLLERFPRFETSAYLLLIVVGAKLVFDWLFNTAEHPHVLDFHDPGSAAFWAFWLLMAICLGIGFLPPRSPKREA
jgi:YkoY family integral membrane protein